MQNIADIFKKYINQDDDDERTVALGGAPGAKEDDEDEDDGSAATPMAAAAATTAAAPSGGGSDFLGQALIGLGPALLGTALGGAQGGALGGATGAEAIKDYQKMKVAQAQRDATMAYRQSNIDVKKQNAETAAKRGAEYEKTQEQLREIQRQQLDERKREADARNKEVGLKGQELASHRADVEDDKTNKRFTDMDNYLSTYKGRNGELGRMQQTMNNADKLMVLAQQNPDMNFSRNQMTELATAAAALISGGTHPAESTIQHLLPSSVGSDAAKMADWLTGSPHGANQQGFVRQLLDTAKREKELAASKIAGELFPRINAYSDLRKKDAERFKTLLQGRGLDPDQYEKFVANGGKMPQAVSEALSQAADPRVLGIMKAHPELTQEQAARALEIARKRGLIN